MVHSKHMTVYIPPFPLNSMSEPRSLEPLTLSLYHLASRLFINPFFTSQSTAHLSLAGLFLIPLRRPVHSLELVSSQLKCTHFKRFQT